jgi:hypothetical protein
MLNADGKAQQKGNRCAMAGVPLRWLMVEG